MAKPDDATGRTGHDDDGSDVVLVDEADETRPRFGIHLPWKPRPVTSAILAVLGVVYALEVAIGGSSPPVAVLDAMGAAYAPKMHPGTGAFEWWRYLTASLLHGGPLHIGCNAIALAMAGGIVESLVGKDYLVPVFAIGAVGGAVADALTGGDELVSTGASGAITGVLAFAFVVAFALRDKTSRRRVQGATARILVPALLPIFGTIGGAKIDVVAHIGGAIAGALAAIPMTLTVRKGVPIPRFLGAALSAAAVLAYGAAVACVARNAAAIEAVAALPADVLVDEADIPRDPRIADATVDAWGRGHERDPRVHLHRAMRALRNERAEGDGDPVAEAELRASLADPAVFAAHFQDGRLESFLRVTLATLLFSDGKSSEIPAVLAPLCTSPEPKGAGLAAAPAEIRALARCR